LFLIKLCFKRKLPFALSILLSLSSFTVFSQTISQQKAKDNRPETRLSDGSFIVCDQISLDNSSQITFSGAANLETTNALVQNAIRIVYNTKAKSFTVFHPAMMRVGSATFQSEKIEYIPATNTINILP
jgi:hypothetical protein